MVYRYQEVKNQASAKREERILKYAYLVKHMVARFVRRLPSSVMFDELVSAGSLGLIDAADKFDSGKHVSFKTYAQYRIKGAILDELRSMDTYSRSMRKKIQDIEKATRKVESSKGAPATEPEVAREMGVALDDYHNILTNIHGAAVLSLDAFIKSKDNDTSSRTRFQAGFKGKDDPALHLDRGEVKQLLTGAIQKLGEKEQLVVSLYYYEELTLKEIGGVILIPEVFRELLQEGRHGRHHYRRRRPYLPG